MACTPDGIAGLTVPMAADPGRSARAETLDAIRPLSVLG
jgi:hypothetical protein